MLNIDHNECIICGKPRNNSYYFCSDCLNDIVKKATKHKLVHDTSDYIKQFELDFTDKKEDK